MVNTSDQVINPDLVGTLPLRRKQLANFFGGLPGLELFLPSHCFGTGFKGFIAYQNPWTVPMRILAKMFFLLGTVVLIQATLQVVSMTDV